MIRSIVKGIVVVLALAASFGAGVLFAVIAEALSEEIDDRLG